MHARVPATWPPSTSPPHGATRTCSACSSHCATRTAGAFSDDEVRDEALTLILSGHETTANALTWAFSYLAAEPATRAALEAEADAQAWLDEGRTPTVEELMAAPYAGAVLDEALRLAPPVWVAPRRALHDVDIVGVQVPKGAHRRGQPVRHAPRPRALPRP